MAQGVKVEQLSRRLSLEEIVNSTTHGVGLAQSVAGFVVLLAMAIRHGTAWHVVGCAIYGSTLICLYLASTLYHGIPAPRLERALRILDHSAIYLLIAGTYTPFLLVNLRRGGVRNGDAPWRGSSSSSGLWTISRSSPHCSILRWAGLW